MKTVPHAQPSTFITDRGCRAEVIAALMAIVAFVNILPNDFCYDATAIVERNDRVNEPGQWLSVWQTDYWAGTELDNPNRDLLYRPLTLLSFCVIRVGFGLSPLPHHLFDLLLHACLCVLIVRLCRHLGGPPGTPLIAGVLFAVLPIHTEALNNIVGRADLLAATCTVLAILAHRRSMNCSASLRARLGNNKGTASLRARLGNNKGTASLRARLGNNKGTASLRARLGKNIPAVMQLVWHWRLAAAMAAFGAMTAKESGVSVILIVPLFGWLWGGDTANKRATGFSESMRRFTGAAYLLLPAAGYFMLRYHALGGVMVQGAGLTKTINYLADAPPGQHALGVVQLWGMYWAKTLWPNILCMNYSINAIRLPRGLDNVHVLLGLAITGGLLAASVAGWRRGARQVALLSMAILISYAPTANALILIRTSFAERIWYAPSIWISILAALALSKVRPRSIGLTLLVLLAIPMTARCWVRNAEWQNNGTLYRAAYRDLPDAVGVQVAYGQWLARHGERPGGIAMLQSAITIDPGFVDAHRVLGEAYLHRGENAAALHHLNTAEMLAPGHPTTKRALETARTRVTGSNDSLPKLRAKADQDSDDLETQLALIRKMRDLGMVAEALSETQEHHAKFETSADWHGELAVTLLFAGQRDRAIESYRRSLDIDPADAQRSVELAMLLMERKSPGDLEEAWRWSSHANTLAPEAPSVLACRAELLTLRGEADAAIALYEKAILSLTPGSAQRRIFEQRALSLGR